MNIRSFFRLSATDGVFIFLVLLICQVFFVLREPLWALGLTAAACLICRIQTELGRLLLVFFCALGAVALAKIETSVGKLSWPGDMLLASLLFWGALKALKSNAEKPSWSWRFTGRQWLSLVVIVMLSLSCLVPYFYFHREVAKTWPFPEMSPWILPFAIMAIAFLNGLREELFFRFLLQAHLGSVRQNGVAVIGGALLFGYLHYQAGFPRGYIGVGLTFLFGMLVGIQYRHFRSAPLTWLTHAVTDAVMFVVILLNRG